MKFSTGTGFFVSRDGYIITNNHVVKQCMDIMVSGAVAQSEAVLVANDPKYDLALLKTHVRVPDIGYLSSLKQPLSQGDPVLIVGYPGQTWRTGQSVTRQAHILNTKGPRGEEKWMEFSDVLEKGNSGGPLMDSSGNVVGVVVAKGRSYTYNAAERRDEDVRHFDLAITLPVVRSFLDDNDVAYKEADSGIYQSPKSLAQDALRFVVNVRCKYEEKILTTQ